MPSKQEVQDRIDALELEAQQAASKAMQDAYRHAKAKQGAERLQLQKDCDNAGGHLYAPRYCFICGHDKDAASNTLAHNLGIESFNVGI